MIEPPRDSWVAKCWARLPGEPNERLAVVCAFGWFFLLMAGYQILRPIRESLVSGLPRGEKPKLFTVVFFVTLAAVPVYGWLVSVLSRRRLVHVVFHFFASNLLLFAAWIHWGSPATGVWQGRVFFVWLTVFILFATSVFWSVMADRFTREQGQRLFGPIAAGATLGGIVGSSIATMFATGLGLVKLLLIVSVLLELGLLMATCFQRCTKSAGNVKSGVAPKTHVLAGVVDIARSGYLRSITLYVAMISFCGTMVYMQLTDTAKIALPDRDQRTEFFGGLNLYVQLGTLLVQFVVIGPLMKRLGLSVALCILPLIYAGSFILLGYSSSLLALGVIDVVTRIGAYGVTVPAREVLFTVVDPAAKYKAKSVIDTVVLRGSDAAASNLFAKATSFGSIATMVPWLMLPVTGVWLVTGWLLGRQKTRQT